MAETLYEEFRKGKSISEEDYEQIDIVVIHPAPFHHVPAEQQAGYLKTLDITDVNSILSWATSVGSDSKSIG
jgi:hypothetical protein